MKAIEQVVRHGSAPPDPILQPLLPAEKSPWRTLAGFGRLVPHKGHAKLWAAVLACGAQAEYQDLAAHSGLRLNALRNYRAQILPELALHGLDNPPMPRPVHVRAPLPTVPRTVHRSKRRVAGTLISAERHVLRKRRAARDAGRLSRRVSASKLRAQRLAVRRCGVVRFYAYDRPRFVAASAAKVASIVDNAHSVGQGSSNELPRECVELGRVALVLAACFVISPSTETETEVVDRDGVPAPRISNRSFAVEACPPVAYVTTATEPSTYEIMTPRSSAELLRRCLRRTRQRRPTELPPRHYRCR